MAPDREEQRRRRSRMVRRDLAARGIRDPRVIEAMDTVPREAFVADDLSDAAYDDNPLPIDDGQTISQPYIVAAMAEAAALDPTSRVLEVGTGSGYGAAVLSHLAGEVWSIERHAHLAAVATDRLTTQGYDNVRVIHGDGALGLPDAAPFDAIVVTAAAATVPGPLIDQLVIGGRLIIPVGPERSNQTLLRLRRTADGVVEEELGGVRFVPLVSGTAQARLRGADPRS